MENLSDRQTAEAVRGWIDWKYALGLDLTDAGFHYSVLCEFRQRLASGQKEQLLLDKMLHRFQEKELLKARSKQRTDATHVLGQLRELNRLELLGETVRATLNELAAHAPDLLLAMMQAEWKKCYGTRIEDTRLPKTKKTRSAYAGKVGADGFLILDRLEASSLRNCLPFRYFEKSGVATSSGKTGRFILRIEGDAPRKTQAPNRPTKRKPAT